MSGEEEAHEVGLGIEPVVENLASSARCPDDYYDYYNQDRKEKEK
jgi:hypothetical protein